MNDFQQIFLRWLDEGRSDLAVKPLFEKVESERAIVIFSFEKIRSNIALILMPDRLQVNCYKSEFDLRQPWDTLFESRMCEFKSCRVEGWVTEGFSCVARGHDPTPHVSSETREQVQVSHCFDPLARWIADRLESAYWLLFSEYDRAVGGSLQHEDEIEPTTDDDETVYERVRIREKRRRETKYISRFCKPNS